MGSKQVFSLADLTPHLVEGICSLDRIAFERAVRLLRNAKADIDVLRTLVQSLLNNTTLSQRERDRRLTMILAAGAKTDNDLIMIAQATDDPGLRNAVTSLLKPENRKFARVRHLQPGSPPPRSAISEPPSGNITTGKRPARRAATSRFRSVILLGTQQEHQHNASILNDHNFTPLRRDPGDSIENIEELMASDVCGIVIAASWMRSLPAQRQRSTLERICSRTSVIFFRIDESGCSVDVPISLASIQRTIYGLERPSSFFCYGTQCDLTPSDIDTLDQVASLLDLSSGIRISPGEISNNESELLSIAVTKYALGREGTSDSGPRTVTTEFIKTGRSGARIAVVNLNDGGQPLIAKIDSKDRLREELRRHNSFIRRWETRSLEPELHLHLGSALLTYRTVDSAEQPGRPAPTLEERVRLLLDSELGSWGVSPPSENNLEIALARATNKLAALNRKHITSREPKLGWIESSLRSNRERGVEWNIYDLDGNKVDLVGLASQSSKIVARLDGMATIHGDVHLHNIVVCDDREPVFIDYAESGPGHPCYDLVRLDAALSFKAARMLDTEEHLARLFHALMVEGIDYDSAERSFPALFRSAGNRLAIKTKIASRTECIDVLASYGGSIVDYLATQFLVGASALLTIDSQCGVVRSLLRAISKDLPSEG